MSFFYISFAGDEGFRGATVVAERNVERALRKTWRLGINPGGEAAFIELPQEAENSPEVMEEVTRMLNRLVPKEEVLAYGGARMLDQPQEMQDKFESDATFVCARHNK